MPQNWITFYQTYQFNLGFVRQIHTFVTETDVSLLLQTGQQAIGLWVRPIQTITIVGEYINSVSGNASRLRLNAAYGNHIT